MPESFDDLVATYGPTAAFSEHQPGESITYHAAEGATRSGTIIWVAAASRVGERQLPLRYIVAPDVDDLGMPDIVLPADLIEDQ